jgi:hypothetical protein
MKHPELLVASWVAMAVVTAVSGEAAQERVTDLPRLATNLDLSESGVRRWLKQLGVTDDGPPTERLLAVSPTGKPLLERDGASHTVRVDSELDNVLRRPSMAVVLIHNHPRNVGLSVADLQQLGKPGVAAIVAIGHDGSVFLASAGPRLDRDWFTERQYGLAKAEVQERLRAEWPSRRVSVAASDAHFSHVVTLALAKAGIVRYWFNLRGTGRQSFESARLSFSWVVVGAAARLSKNE